MTIIFLLGRQFGEAFAPITDQINMPTQSLILETSFLRKFFYHINQKMFSFGVGGKHKLKWRPSAAF